MLPITQFLQTKPTTLKNQPNSPTQPTTHNTQPETQPDSPFTIHTANRWLQLESLQPEAQMLFGNFWHQNELCFLYADTNAGKSILAVQLGHELARGAALEPFANNAPPANVLYIDFELTPGQFRARYNERHATHNFADNFYRAEFNPEAQLPPGYKTAEQYLKAAITNAIEATSARVLIIDNISCLHNGGAGLADHAIALMKQLKALKSRHRLSILVLAHTPKRNPANPISRDDLQGSKMLINFADSAFAIGESHTHPGFRYLKQVKQRTGPELYGRDNICLFRLEKQFGYLRFQFTGYAHEADHLRRHTYSQRVRLQQIAFQHKADGLSQRQTAAKMNLSLSTVNKLLNWK